MFISVIPQRITTLLRIIKMIQRKQTIFLLLAFIATMVCLCCPVAYFQPLEMGVNCIMRNLWLDKGNSITDFSVWPLFALLVLSTVLSLYTIFLYKKRKIQVALCLLNILFLLGWNIVYIYYIYQITLSTRSNYIFTITAVLPLLSLILILLAHKSIIADEKLIRSIDRIR